MKKLIIRGKNNVKVNGYCGKCGIYLNILDEKTHKYNHKFLCYDCYRQTVTKGKLISDITKTNPVTHLGPRGISREEFDRRLKLDSVELMMASSDPKETAFLSMHYCKATNRAYFFANVLYYNDFWDDEILGATNITSDELQRYAHMNGVHRFDGLTEENWQDYFKFDSWTNPSAQKTEPQTKQSQNPVPVQQEKDESDSPSEVFRCSLYENKRIGGAKSIDLFTYGSFGTEFRGRKWDGVFVRFDLEGGYPYVNMVYGYGAMVPREYDERISFGELAAMRPKYAGLNESNWRQYFQKELSTYESQKAKKSLRRKSINREELSEEYYDDSSEVLINCFEYNQSLVYFRKTPRGYRAFYASMWNRMSVYTSDITDENYITKLLKGKTACSNYGDFYDRLLSHEEALYILQTIKTSNIKDRVIRCLGGYIHTSDRKKELKHEVSDNIFSTIMDIAINGSNYSLKQET